MSESPVALVTGAAQGLGAAICEVLLRNGYKVCASDIQKEKGEKFMEEQQKKFGIDKIKFTVCDVTKEEEFERAFEYVLKEFKRIDLLVNNAGSVNEQNPKKIVNLNLMGTINGCQLAVKYMSKSNGGKGGMVINIASALGIIPFPGTPVYSATKHAVVGLTRSYGDAYHFEKHEVSFVALCPAAIDTEFKNFIQSNSLIPNFQYYQENPDKVMTVTKTISSSLQPMEGDKSDFLYIIAKGGKFFGTLLFLNSVFDSTQISQS